MSCCDAYCVKQYKLYCISQTVNLYFKCEMCSLPSAHHIASHLLTSRRASSEGRLIENLDSIIIRKSNVKFSDLVQFLEFSESYSGLEFPKPFQIKCEDHSKLHFIAKFALNTIFRLEIFELPISVDLLSSNN